MDHYEENYDEIFSSMRFLTQNEMKEQEPELYELCELGLGNDSYSVKENLHKFFDKRVWFHCDIHTEPCMNDEDASYIYIIDFDKKDIIVKSHESYRDEQLYKENTISFELINACF